MFNYPLKTIISSVSSIFFLAAPVKAQLIPDNTLGRENSKIIQTTNPNRNNITGGATRGINLFHSFREFNINSGRAVYFNNPAGVENILTRVTGGNVSNILGTLGVNGNANLYLINPNGIYFGNGARLDLRGSFVGTTADGIKLGTDGLFNAINPENSNLLTIEPSARFVNPNRTSKSKIINEGNLEVNSGANITLSADEIINTGTITARSGKIFFEAIKGNIEVGNINVSASLDNTGKRVENGGDINLEANGNITFNNSKITSEGILSGELNIHTQGILSANNTSILYLSQGDIATKSGQITISAKSINLNDSFLKKITEGIVSTGDLFIKAEKIEIVGINNIENSPAGVFNQSRGQGDVGLTQIYTETLEMNSGSQINTSTFGKGGNGGSLDIIAKDILISGVNPEGNSGTGLYSRVQRENFFVRVESGKGNAGPINIITDSLKLKDGGVISTTTFAGGNGGNLNIKAKNILLSGVNIPGGGDIASGLYGGSFGEGNGGLIVINTDTLRLDNGAIINVSSFDKGSGGNVEIYAKDIQLIGKNPINNIGRSGIFSSAFDFFSNGFNTGNGGDINIITEKIKVKDGATINASNFQAVNSRPPGLGKTGNITIKSDEINLNRGTITTNGNRKGGGNIKIDTSRFIVLKNKSKISTNVGQAIGFSGGNLTINSPFIVALPKDNEFTATAISSQGGNININTKFIFGYPQNLKIDASSQLGIDGNVNINGLTNEINQLTFESENFSVEPDQIPELKKCPLQYGLNKISLQSESNREIPATVGACKNEKGNVVIF